MKFLITLWFFPICFIISLVMTATKEEDFKVIFVKSTKTFLMLSIAILAGCIVIFLLGKFL